MPFSERAGPFAPRKEHELVPSFVDCFRCEAFCRTLLVHIDQGRL